jgi:ankyrin repeat protein
MPIRKILAVILAASIAAPLVGDAIAQMPPSKSDVAGYTGLLAAAYAGDANMLRRLIAAGADLAVIDSGGRTPLHLAAYRSDEAIVSILAEAGADLNALDAQAYDIVTIAAVANDPEMVRCALLLGTNARNVTSPYDGTALIAAAHLGHFEVVEILVAAGAPLDHINNIEWTAVIEAIVLGDGGMNHQKTLKALLDGGADPNIGDGDSVTPLQLARQRRYQEMVQLLIAAGAR